MTVTAVGGLFSADVRKTCLFSQWARAIDLWMTLFSRVIVEIEYGLIRNMVEPVNSVCGILCHGEIDFYSSNIISSKYVCYSTHER